MQRDYILSQPRLLYPIQILRTLAFSPLCIYSLSPSRADVCTTNSNDALARALVGSSKAIKALLRLYQGSTKALLSIKLMLITTRHKERAAYERIALYSGRYHGSSKALYRRY